jgi:hypothetical protein
MLASIFVTRCVLSFSLRSVGRECANTCIYMLLSAVNMKRQLINIFIIQCACFTFRWLQLFDCSSPVTSVAVIILIRNVDAVERLSRSVRAIMRS